MYSELDR